MKKILMVLMAVGCISNIAMADDYYPGISNPDNHTQAEIMQGNQIQMNNAVIGGLNQQWCRNNPVECEKQKNATTGLIIQGLDMMKNSQAEKMKTDEAAFKKAQQVCPSYYHQMGKVESFAVSAKNKIDFSMKLEDEFGADYDFIQKYCMSTKAVDAFGLKTVKDQKTGKAQSMNTILKAWKFDVDQPSNRQVMTDWMHIYGFECGEVSQIAQRGVEVYKGFWKVTCDGSKSYLLNLNDNDEGSISGATRKEIPVISTCGVRVDWKTFNPQNARTVDCEASHKLKSYGGMH